MSKPDFSKIEYQRTTQNAELPHKEWETPEGITIKNRYSSDDMADVTHRQFVAGIPPYLRGPYSSMYAGRPLSLIHISEPTRPY